MANTALTIDMVTRACTARLESKLNFVKTLDHQFDKSFGVAGAKIGTALRVRYPGRFLGGTGADITSNIEFAVDTQDSITVATQKHVAMSFSSAEAVLSFDEYDQRYIQPAASQLAALVESDILGGMYKGVANQVGTAGTTPSTALTFLNAGKLISESGCDDMDNRSVVLDFAAANAVINAQTGFYNPSKSIETQYKRGVVMNQWGFDFLTNPMIPRHVNGNDVTGATVQANVANGASTVIIAGLTATTGTIKAGQSFTIAAVNAIHPQTKVSYGRLQQFTATADATADGSGYATVTVTPALTYTSSAAQNIDAQGLASAAVTFEGAVGPTAYPINMAYHKNACAVVFANLDSAKVPGAERRVVNYENISLRMTEQYDIRLDKRIIRLDVLYGYKVIRPEFACRIIG